MCINFAQSSLNELKRPLRSPRMQNYVMERLAEQKGQTENKQTKKDCWGPTDLALSLIPTTHGGSLSIRLGREETVMSSPA